MMIILTFSELLFGQSRLDTTAILHFDYERLWNNYGHKGNFGIQIRGDTLFSGILFYGGAFGIGSWYQDFENHVGLHTFDVAVRTNYELNNRFHYGAGMVVGSAFYSNSQNSLLYVRPMMGIEASLQTTIDDHFGIELWTRPSIVFGSGFLWSSFSFSTGLRFFFTAPWTAQTASQKLVTSEMSQRIVNIQDSVTTYTRNLNAKLELTLKELTDLKDFIAKVQRDTVIPFSTQIRKLEREKRDLEQKSAKIEEQLRTVRDELQRKHSEPISAPSPTLSTVAPYQSGKYPPFIHRRMDLSNRDIVYILDINEDIFEGDLLVDDSILETTLLTLNDYTQYVWQIEYRDPTNGKSQAEAIKNYLQARNQRLQRRLEIGNRPNNNISGKFAFRCLGEVKE